MRRMKKKMQYMFYKSDTSAEVQKMMCVPEHQLAPLDLRNAQNRLLTTNGEYLLDL
jgi:hypothetical protein